MIYKKYSILIGIWALAISASAQNPDMAQVKQGAYVPLYGTEGMSVKVNEFLIDTVPVTKAAYRDFLKANPKWKKSEIKGLFADKNYLRDWESDLDFGKGKENEPVTNVSWFAAKEYCKCQGKRLPTVDEWEYVGMADARTQDAREKESYNQFILSWYESPKKIGQTVGSTFRNYWGVYDIHGLVWEWTSDFNSILISSESRSSSTNPNLFCSAAAVGASDLMNYAAFMRYAFRSSIKGSYSGNNLGFRCAKDIEDGDKSS